MKTIRWSKWPVDLHETILRLLVESGEITEEAQLMDLDHVMEEAAFAERQGRRAPPTSQRAFAERWGGLSRHRVRVLIDRWRSTNDRPLFDHSSTNDRPTTDQHRTVEAVESGDIRPTTDHSSTTLRPTTDQRPTRRPRNSIVERQQSGASSLQPLASSLQPLEQEQQEPNGSAQAAAEDEGELRTQCNGVPCTPSEQEQQQLLGKGKGEQDQPPADRAPPAWATSAARQAPFTAHELTEAVGTMLSEVRGVSVNPHRRCKTDATQILGLWRADDWPPIAVFVQDFCRVARAAQQCRDPLFARDIRGEDWEGARDRSRDVGTLVVQARWSARRIAAEAWEQVEASKARRQATPPPKVLVGLKAKLSNNHRLEGSK